MKVTKTKIIAEIAQGYEGNISRLKKLTNEVSEVAVDGVKYQLIYADELSTPDYIHYSLFKSLEMNLKSWRWASQKLKSKSKKLYFDIFGLKRFQIAKILNADGVKISTTEFYNTILINKSLKTFKEVFISVGGVPWKDIKKLTKSLSKKHLKKITFMYGLQAEPTKISDNNLLKLKLLMQKLKEFKFGFMDHSHGGKSESLYLSLLTLGQGVSLIEKHFTLDRKLKIEDYVSGITKKNLEKFVGLVRYYEMALGNEKLSLTKAEIDYSYKALKVVVAEKNISQDKKIENSDVSLKRTKRRYNNNQYKRVEDVVGKISRKSIKKNELILKNYL